MISLALAALLLAEPVVLRVGITAPEGSPWGEAVVEIARKMAENTGGGVKLRVLSGAVLGSEAEMGASALRGGLDGWGPTAGAAAEFVPEVGAFELPFLFPDNEAVDRALARSWKRLQACFADRGLLVAGIMDVGFRQIGSPGPVSTLAELRALRMRSQPSPVHARMWALLGVPHTPIDIPDVVGALEGKRVNAFDGAIVWAFAANWHRHVRHMTLTRHVYQPAMLVLSKAGLAKIPPRLRARLDQGLLAVSMRAARKIREVEEKLLEVLPTLDVRVTPAPGALDGEMRRALAPMREGWRRSASPAGRALLGLLEGAK